MNPREAEYIPEVLAVYSIYIAPVLIAPGRVASASSCLHSKRHVGFMAHLYPKEDE